MKIDFLISKMSDGGAQRVISLIANYLDDRGHQARVISFVGGDHYPLNSSVKRVELHDQPLIKSVVFSGFFSCGHQLISRTLHFFLIRYRPFG